jgi:hypothetical protein
MRNWLMLFALAASMMHAQAGAQQTEANVAAQPPSRLDSFLTANPGATRTTRFLERLTGTGDVWDAEINAVRKAEITTTFTAISASSSTISEKGLELQFEYLGNHGEQRPLQTIYIDEAILGQFQQELDRTAGILRERLDWQHRHPTEYLTESDYWCAFAGATVTYLSVAPEDQGDEWLRQKVFAAGWYWKVNAGGEEPVGRACLCLLRGHSGQFHFPQTTLDQLIAIVAKGRAFLAAN